MKELAPDYVSIYKSPDPSKIFCYSPAMLVLPSGRLIATLDIREIPPRGPEEDYEGWWKESERSWWIGKAFISDDKGKTWRFTTNFPFIHARPFQAGNSIYILGHAGDLMVMRSDDEGETWTKPVRLTDNQTWHQAPCGYCEANGSIYLVMERQVYNDVKGWAVSTLAPVLMRGRLDSDLTKRENWTYADEVAFRDWIDYDKLNYVGIPFFPQEKNDRIWIAPNRPMAPSGWLEANVVQIHDPLHQWYDERGKTFHLVLRFHSGGTNMAALMKVVENDDGTMTTTVQKTPSGEDMLFIPLPGGQMKFHILYDDVSGYYWLLSSQATDSLIKPEKMPPERFDLPNNERHRLQLFFSRNCYDWCFAGMVTIGPAANQARHYASLAIDGDDLYVTSRSGDEKAFNAHETNLISFHVVKDFRKLIY